MLRDSELDYRTRETQLLRILQRRFYFDVVKFAGVGFLYPAFRLWGFLNAGSASTWAIVGAWLSSAPWDVVAVAVVTGIFQVKNIKSYRKDVLRRAKKIAAEHGARQA